MSVSIHLQQQNLLWVRYHSRSFLQVGHKPLHAAIGYHYFFAITYNLQTYQKYQRPL